MMSPTLRLTREARGIELRRGRFEVLVDGTRVQSFDRNETVEISLEPGHHTLRILAGRYSSRDQSFDVADGEVINFRSHGAMIWPTYVASIVKPNLAISLKRERLVDTQLLSSVCGIEASVKLNRVAVGAIELDDRLECSEVVEMSDLHALLQRSIPSSGFG
jgi:hypothetical protein